MGMETFWLKDSRRLVDVAMGRKPADLVIRDGRWVCVQSGEIIAHTDIAIAGHRIAYVGEDARHCHRRRTPRSSRQRAGSWSRGSWTATCTWSRAC